MSNSTIITSHPFHLLQIAQVYLICFTFNTVTGKVEKALL